MPIPTRRALAGAALSALGAAACGGPHPDTAAGGSAPTVAAAAVDTPTPAPARDACALVTAAEASAAAGAPVVPKPDRGTSPRKTVCEYFRPGGGPGFALTAYWSGGARALDLAVGAERPGTAVAERALPVAGMNVRKALGYAPVPALGDEAYYNGVMGAYVRRGDVLLEFDVRALPGGRAGFEALARAALARL